MKTKIVYTVVSSENAPYLPQALIAIYTARLYNPTAEIILVVDQDTNHVIQLKLPRIGKYVNKIIEVKLPNEMSNMHRSRYLKTTLRNVVDGDFLFVDTDTVVTGDLSSIDDCNAIVGAVIDRHAYIEEHELREQIIRELLPFGISIEDLKSRYYNSGVMYVKNSSKAYHLFELWHKNWENSLNFASGIDQPSLALANKQCGYVIEELDGEWNCQLADNFINYLQNAKVLHYFASDGKSPYLLNDARTFQEVMKVGDIPSWLKQKLETPKCYFIEKHFLAFDEDVHFLRTNVHTMYIYHRWIFNLLEFISKNLIHISKIIK